MPVTSLTRTVSWRQTCAVLLATVLAMTALVIVMRSDGLPAVDAASSRATRWFVHQNTGRAVLVDGFGGRALASVDTGARGDELFVAEGAGQAFVLNDTTAEVRAIDSAELRLGPPQAFGTLGSGSAVARAGAAGLLVANPLERSASLLQPAGESLGITFDLDDGTVRSNADKLALSPDGSVWTLADGALERATSTANTSESLGIEDGAVTLVGNRPFVVDRVGRRARLGDGAWQSLPTAAPPSEIVAQQAGPVGDCGWVAANDDLWCVGTSGIVESATIDGLDVDGGDVFAIAGDASALVRRGPSEVVQFDWRTEEILDREAASVASDVDLDVIATIDLVWIDDVAGNFVWSVHPWGVEVIQKNDDNILVLGDEGDVIEAGENTTGDVTGTDAGDLEEQRNEPDDNGIDDPPVAIDDPVTARSGGSVPVAVTANDYDPDGEAIAVVDVGVPGHGTVEIGTASTVVYTPDPGYVGLDEFDYTIVDGDGTEASADVIVELLPADATNQPPVGSSDSAQTGPGVPVVIDVLLNDIDPERDSLQIASFTDAEGLGEVKETEGLSGLPALEFQPNDGFEGTATFSYRPVDAFEAVGEDVTVEVEVARAGDENRPPIVLPDALRTRRNRPSPLPVLVNDKDPDGDRLELSVVRPLPDGLDVEVQGDQLSITARPGSGPRATFEYAVDDGHDHVVRGGVLVEIIDELEPNGPPVVSPDVATAVVGQTIIIDVTANDVDPDGDPLAVVDVTQPKDRGDATIVDGDQVQFTPTSFEDEEEANARFSYTVSDGQGHEVVGDITVTVLAEALSKPPYARDDSTFTFVDEPVTIDVLRNDGDPSGERPTIVGTPGCPTGGSATVTADGQVRFDPPLGQSGAFRCTYEVTNSRGLRDSAAIIISVREPESTNVPPIAVLDSVTVEVEQSKSIVLTNNDRDPDGDDAALEVIATTAPLLGTAERNGNTITFTAGSETGVTTIEYQLQDVGGAITTGRAQFRIVPKQNLAPLPQPDVKTVEAGVGAQTFDVLANDSDPDDSPGGLSLVSVSRTGGDGTVEKLGDIVVVTPAPEFEGDITATYTIVDGDGLDASSTLTLRVLPPANRPPEANDDTADVPNGGSVTASVLFNDSDPDGDPLTVSIVSGADSALGTATVTAENAIFFDARPGQAGTAAITYQVTDGELTDSATLRINVQTCLASTPSAQSAFLSTGYEKPIAVDLGQFSANGAIVDVVAPPTYADGVYTPPAGMNGNATISWAVVNECQERATGTITIDVNQDPVGQDRSVSLGRGAVEVLPVSVLGSDDEPLSILSSAGAPAWVTTTPQQLTIAPGTDAPFGSTSWTTTLVDPGGLTTSVTVTATVVNQAPVAVGDAVIASSGNPVVVDVVANDSDPDGDNSTLRVQSVPSTLTFPNGGTGSVSLLGNGRSLRIDPGTGEGEASFVYTVIDPGGAVSAPATVTVEGPVGNTPPYAKDQTVEVVPGVGTAVSLDAGDLDGDPVTVENLADPSGVVVARSGLTLTVSAPTDGVFAVTYQVSDGQDLSGVATLRVVAVAPPTTSTTSTTSTSVPTTSLADS